MYTPLPPTIHGGDLVIPTLCKFLLCGFYSLAHIHMQNYIFLFKLYSAERAVVCVKIVY